MSEVREQIAAVIRRERGQLLGAAVRIVRDLSLAEELVQDAVVAALESWPRDGIPDRPGAWLTLTARRRAIDRVRGDVLHRERAEVLHHEETLRRGPTVASLEQLETVPDDALRLMFLCCHPSLPTASRVALTLSLVSGLSTPELAAAFLVPTPTMAQRLVRAKRALREVGADLEVPGPRQVPERLADVLAVAYLVFNEGYAAREGASRSRSAWLAEGLRLAEALVVQLPDAAEGWGLLALMAFQASRAATHVDAGGDVVLLADQDRRRWDGALIARGRHALDTAVLLDAPGPYQLQAAIAACHADAPSWETTDWSRVVGLYDHLLACAPTPVVALNRAVALGMAKGPAAALSETDGLTGTLGRYHLLHACRADWWRQLGRKEEAVAAYREALAWVDNERERRFLARRLAEVEG